MKYIFSTCILLFVCLAQSVRAQGTRIDYFPDSIRIELPAHEGLVVLEMENYVKTKEHLKSFPQLLESLLVQIQKSLPTDFSENGPYNIDITITHEDEDQIIGLGLPNFRTIGEKTLISISKPVVEQTEVKVRHGEIIELMPPGWSLTIRTKRFVATVYSSTFRGLQEIAQEDFEKVDAHITADLGSTFLGRKSVRSRLVMQDGKIVQDTLTYFHPLDMLSLSLEGAVGVVQTRIYPELSANASIWLYDRYNRPRTKFQLVYENMFFAERRPEGGYESHINSFLSFSIAKNFRKDHGQPRWTGLGVGYLVRQSGDYFTGNTLKFFLSSDVGSRFRVLPEFYLTDDFKKFNFGLKFRYIF